MKKMKNTEQSEHLPIETKDNYLDDLKKYKCVLIGNEKWFYK